MRNNFFLNINFKAISIILAISLIFRVGYSIYSFNTIDTSRFGDDWDYISYAQNILDQGVWVEDISKLRGNAHLVGPGFPLVLAGIFKIFGEKYVAVYLINSLISSIMVVLMIYLGKELFNNRVGFMSGTWCVFYVLFIYYIPTCLKEVWLIFFITLCIYLFILDTKREKITWRNSIFVCAYSFLIHVDERFFSLFPIFLIFYAILDNSNWRNGLYKATIFGIFVCLSMIPWSIRNYKVYQKPIILTKRTEPLTDLILFKDTDGERNYRYGYDYNLDLYQSYADSIMKGLQVKDSFVFKKTLTRGIELGYIPHRFNKIERWYAEFMEYWRPVRFKGGYINHGFRFQGPAWSWYGNLSRGLTYGILLPFFVFGIFLIIKSKNKYGYFLLSIIFVHMYTHIELFHVVNRYRIQIDPLVILISFYCVDYLFTKYKLNLLQEKSLS